MTSILNSSSSSTVALATAMAVSGTVIVLALRLQKSLSSLSDNQFSVPRSCISSDEKKREVKKKKKKKRVHFAEDVVDPIGNSEEFRRRLNHRKNKTNNSNSKQKREMPANRIALYNGILRHRVVQHPAYFC